MPVQVEMVGDRIWLRSPYNPSRPDKAKRIVGASWRKRDKVWTYPLDMVICRDLREQFGNSLEIGPKLTAWAKDQVDREGRLRELLTARDTDNLELLPKRAPLIWAAMNDGQHEYQKPVVEYMVLAGRSQNASQPGLGKTIETLAALVEADVRGLILVAAPKTSLRTVWEPEVRRWLPGTPVFACTGGKQRRLDTIRQAMTTWAEGKHSLVFVIINPEMLRTRKHEDCLECDGSEEAHTDNHKVAVWYDHEYPQLFDEPWSAFVVDETHRYIMKVNLRSKSATQTGTGAMMIKTAPDAMKIALSGTPWKGKTKNAWAVKHWLDGDTGLGASFWNWARRMYDVSDGEYGGQVLGEMRDPQTFNKWCDTFMIRHTKAEMAPFLPPKSYGGTPLDPEDPYSPIGVWLEMEGKQEKAYKAMDEDATVQLENGLLIGNGVLAEMTRLKQFATSHGDMVDRLVKGEAVKTFVPDLPSNKYEWVVQFLNEHGITGDADVEGSSKVVLASQWTQVINLVSDNLSKIGIANYKLTGETKDRDREAFVRKFQEQDDVRVFLLNTMAGGVSVTLDAADDLVFFDETWTPDDQEQVEDRTHRTSRIHNVTIWYLRTLGTIDERIARLNMTADSIQKQLLDGKRGVQFAKQLLGGDK